MALHLVYMYVCGGCSIYNKKNIYRSYSIYKSRKAFNPRANLLRYEIMALGCHICMDLILESVLLILKLFKINTVAEVPH